MILRIRKSAAFEYLPCLNIIQGLRDKGPSIGARVSCVTFKPSVLTFLDRNDRPMRMGRNEVAIGLLSLENGLSERSPIETSFSSERSPIYKVGIWQSN